MSHTHSTVWLVKSFLTHCIPVSPQCPCQLSKFAEKTQQLGQQKKPHISLPLLSPTKNITHLAKKMFFCYIQPKCDRKIQFRFMYRSVGFGAFSAGYPKRNTAYKSTTLLCVLCEIHTLSKITCKMQALLPLSDLSNQFQINQQSLNSLIVTLIFLLHSMVQNKF